jgi:putative hydrolase of the HAD superfamily
VNETNDGAAIDWQRVKLVVFDVDGTLYRQRMLRMRVAGDMLLHVIRHCTAEVPSVIRTYRQLRERMGSAEVVGFEARLIGETSRLTGRPRVRVQSIVQEWIDRRPLPHLAVARYPGVLELFAAIKRAGTTIGIFSDYPAHAKLAALGLAADLVKSASDDDMGVLKPNPRGLQLIIRAAGVTAADTIMIGDRPERDGIAARRAGTRCLIRSARACPGWRTFATYRSSIFTPLFD